MKCQRCDEEGAIEVGNIDDYGQLCPACLSDYVDEMEILEMIIANQSKGETK